MEEGGFTNDPKKKNVTWRETKAEQGQKGQQSTVWLIPGMLAQQRTADAAELGAVGSLIKATPVMFWESTWLNS